MDGGEEHRRIGLEHGLSAVTMVDVEVGDGDARRAGGLGGAGGDGDVGEQAEAHGAGWTGVVPGRAHGAEGALDVAAGRGPGRLNDAAGRPHRGAERARRDLGVRVGVGDAIGWSQGLDRLHERLAMHPGQVRGLDRRRLAAIKNQPGLIGHCIQHRPQPLRPFRVTRPRTVQGHFRVAIEDEVHSRSLTPEAHLDHDGNHDLAAPPHRTPPS